MHATADFYMIIFKVHFHQKTLLIRNTIVIGLQYRNKSAGDTNKVHNIIERFVISLWNQV